MMKKKIFIVMAALAMCIPMTAKVNDASKAESLASYEFNTNKGKLFSYLKTDSLQSEIGTLFVEEFEDGMLFASQMATVEKRDTIVSNLMRKHLAHMRYVLDRQQYAKYLRVLNATFNNRGINVAFHK